MMCLPELLTVNQLCERHPAFTQGGVRDLIFHCSKNGFDKCIVRIGRKILISTDALGQWINDQNENKLVVPSSIGSKK